MAVIEIAKIQVRRGQENVTGVPMLDPGELGWAEDTQNLYIGKRISEGANSDNNTRILTEVDLRNIFNALGGGTTGSVASTSTYRYRDDLPYCLLYTSDAADEEDSVDLGGRRIIKKKSSSLRQFHEFQRIALSLIHI